MSTEGSDSKGLHLPDLVVKGFRGIEDLTVSRLGRVNLISGRNSVGKTTLLEAIRVYAARGRYQALLDVLQPREELIDATDEDGDETLAPDWDSLFHGRLISDSSHISIGPTSENGQLSIEAEPLSDEGFSSWNNFLPEYFLEGDLKSLKVKFQDVQQEMPIIPGIRLPRRRASSSEPELPPVLPCETQGPSLPSNEDIARFWDRVALTDDERRAIYALNLIFGDKIEGVNMIGDFSLRRSSVFPARTRYDRPGRRAVVKITEEDGRVPLKSLGDGAARLFGLALALANSRDGLLIIDEAENGIHYSVQYDFWKMVLQTAQENNVQVFATTHSLECIRSFAYAALELEDVEGTLVRLYKRDDRVRAIEYSENDLRVVAEQGIEVR